jgi:hypothetical protein
MPGSKNVGEQIVLTGISSGTGDPAPTAARTRRQRTHQAQLIPINPQAQMLKRTEGSGLRAAGAGAIETIGEVNGSLTSTITMERFDGTGASRHSK